MMTATMENKTEILTKLSENEELKNALKIKKKKINQSLLTSSKTNNVKIKGIKK